MDRCVTNKKMFTTLEMAEDALVDAWIKYEYAPHAGPVAVYQCTDCGYYHFTSQGPMNDKLSRHLENGKIDLHKEANYWMDKIKRR